MPCCQWVLSIVANSTSTPSWLHRLHAKGGLSFPSDLHIDDLFYGQQPQPPPLSLPPPRSSPSNPRAATPQGPPPNLKHLQNPPRNLSEPNPGGNNNPAQAPLSGVVSDVPCSPRSTRQPKLFRKRSRPGIQPDDNSPPPHRKDKTGKDKAKARKRHRADRAADADGEKRTSTEVTVIDTSIDGWKASKLLIRRGAVWKVRDKKGSGISEPEEHSKGKRRTGLVAKIQRDKEKRKDVALPGNIRASSGDEMKEPDGSTQMLKRQRCSEPVPEGQRAEVLLKNTRSFSQP